MENVCLRISSVQTVEKRDKQGQDLNQLEANGALVLCVAGLDAI